MLLVLVLASIFCVATTALPAQVTHYSVKLTPDLDGQIVRAEQQIEFQHDAGAVVWQKQKGLQIASAVMDGGLPYGPSVSRQPTEERARPE